MLKNDYLVAKIGVDTAENELFKVGVNAQTSLQNAKSGQLGAAGRAQQAVQPPGR